jgi:uncharacterized delta-60 repeat protein
MKYFCKKKKSLLFKGIIACDCDYVVRWIEQGDLYCSGGLYMELNTRALLTSFFLLSFFFCQDVVAASDLDTTFGEGLGYTATQYGQGIGIQDIQVQADGSIILIGQTTNPNKQGMIIQYMPDGSIDTTFGTDGVALLSMGSSLSTTVFNAAALQSDSSIVVAGYTYDTGSSTQILIARYTSDGILDPTFGTGGTVQSSIGDGATLNGLSLDASGNIVGVGTTVVGGAPMALLVRLTPTGSFDATFGTDGVVTELFGLRTVLNDIQLDASGNIVAVGYSSIVTGDQLLVVRHLTDGSLDGTFGSGGVVTTAVGTRAVANSVAFDSSGNSIVAGFTNDGTTNNCLVARYTPSGTLDNTFGIGGLVTQLVGTSSSLNDLVISASGSIVVCGSSNFNGDQAIIVRYTSAGIADSTFGENGVITLLVGQGARFYALAQQPSDGRVVAGGTETDSTVSQSFGLVARCNQNNSDFVSITSITTTEISTKTPTISGTSSAPNAQVNVLLNGTAFTTVSTDGSGNWNAGTSSILPIGPNLIEADLIVSGATLVSQQLNVTVLDTFSSQIVLVQGSVPTTGSGTGTGYSYSNSGSMMTITFTPAFVAVPLIVATGQRSNGTATVTIATVSSSAINLAFSTGTQKVNFQAALLT